MFAMHTGMLTMRFPARTVCLGLFVLSACAAGCHSPYHADRGALFGGLAGAGTGALIGDAVGGNALAGAAIGAGLGTITGAAVGSSLDEIEARNRAEINARMSRPIAPGAVTVTDVIAMSRAGIDQEVIVTHIQIHGAAHPLQTSDLLHLQNNGVGSRVIQAMQSAPPARHVAQPPPVQPIIVEEHYYGSPWGPYRRHPPYRRYPYGPRNRVSWGITFGR
jgi:hypothetical protein